MPSRNLSARLVVGAVVNIFLLLMIPRLGVWSSDEREFGLALVAGGSGVVAIVSLLPVIKSGRNWQRVIGFILLVLPCLSFWFTFEFILKHK